MLSAVSDTGTREGTTHDQEWEQSILSARSPLDQAVIWNAEIIVVAFLFRAGLCEIPTLASGSPHVTGESFCRQTLQVNGVSRRDATRVACTCKLHVQLLKGAP